MITCYSILFTREILNFSTVLPELLLNVRARLPVLFRIHAGILLQIPFDRETCCPQQFCTCRIDNGGFCL